MRVIACGVLAVILCVGLCSCVTTTSQEGGEGSIIVTATSTVLEEGDKAQVLLDGEEVGVVSVGKTKSLMVYCEQGTHEVVVQAEGCLPHATRVKVKAGSKKSASVDAVLKPVPVEEATEAAE